MASASAVMTVEGAGCGLDRPGPWVVALAGPKPAVNESFLLPLAGSLFFKKEALACLYLSV